MPNNPPTLTVPTSPPRTGVDRAVVTAENVRCVYMSPSPWTLYEAFLTVEENQSGGIARVSESGKSTLIQLLSNPPHDSTIGLVEAAKSAGLQLAS